MPAPRVVRNTRRFVPSNSCKQPNSFLFATNGIAYALAILGQLSGTQPSLPTVSGVTDIQSPQEWNLVEQRQLTAMHHWLDSIDDQQATTRFVTPTSGDCQQHALLHECPQGELEL